MNPFRWIADFIGFLRFMRGMNQKDASGRKRAFLYRSDNAGIADYLGLPPFGKTVFVSFERHSLPIAERLEQSLKTAGLTPWRYQPDVGEEPASDADSMLAIAKDYARQHPGEMETLEATLRRCSAVVFLVSAASLRSAFCDIEAMMAGIIHGGVDDAKAAVYVILEEPHLEPPAFIQKFWRANYQQDIEDAVATLIASEIGAQSAKLETLERFRRQTFQ